MSKERAAPQWLLERDESDVSHASVVIELTGFRDSADAK